jgi:uncharacterized repeat protein (TIGR03806 family)
VNAGLPSHRGAAALSLGGGLIVASLLGGCARAAVRPFLGEPYPERLGDWRLFVGNGAALVPNQGVVPYGVSVPLFSDHAFKYRTLWMPAGRPAQYRDAGAFEFPVGTIFSKTFYYLRGGAADAVRAPATGGEQGGLVGRPEERRLVETRLLVRAEADWMTLPYVWNEQQTEATLEIAGEERRLTWVAAARAEPFVYLVPNADQCASCHVTSGTSRRLRPLGPTARNLNRDFDYADGRANQLARWRQVGYLRGGPEPAAAPSWPAGESGSIALRARAYLDVQCAHCHGPDGPAGPSGLYLGFDEPAPERLGVCKTPVAAGRGSGGLRYDVVPGRPDESILLFRMASREPDVMMPELGRNLRDEAGLALVRRWIEELPGSCEGLAAGEAPGTKRFASSRWMRGRSRASQASSSSGVRKSCPPPRLTSHAVLSNSRQMCGRCS